MSFQNKYLKYKNKYLELKKQIGGSWKVGDRVSTDNGFGEIIKISEVSDSDSDKEETYYIRLDSGDETYQATYYNVNMRHETDIERTRNKIKKEEIQVTSLIKEIYAGKDSQLLAAVDNDPWLNTLGDSLYGKTLLHTACNAGRLQLANDLLLRGAIIDQRDKSGDNALMYASLADRIPVIEMLLSHNVNINTKSNNGNTALHRAAFSSSFSACKLLIAKGADIMIKNNDGETVLDIYGRIPRLSVEEEKQRCKELKNAFLEANESARRRREELLRFIAEDEGEKKDREMRKITDGPITKVGDRAIEVDSGIKGSIIQIHNNYSYPHAIMMGDNGKKYDYNFSHYKKLKE